MQPPLTGFSLRAGWLLVALVVVTFALRVYRLDSQSLWVDEGFTAYNAGLRLAAIPAEIAATDNHPPLHYIVLNLWRRFAGDSVFALRFVSVAAALLTVPLVGQLGRLFLGKAAAVIAAALLALSPFHVWYAQELRMYALLAFWASLSLFCLGALVQLPPAADIPTQNRRRLLWVSYVLSAALALLTHYYAFFLLLVGGGWVLLSRWRRQLLRPWLLAQGAMGVLFASWFPSLWQQYERTSGGFAVPLGLEEVLWRLGEAFALGEHLSSPYNPWFLLGLVLLMAVGSLFPVGRRWGSSWGPVISMLGWLLVPPLCAYLLSLVWGLDLRATGRMYYIASLPAFFLLTARGLVIVGRFVWVPAALLGMVLVSFFSLALYAQYFGSPKEDFRAAAAYIEEHAWPEDAIILHAEHIYPAFLYYYRGPWPWHRAEMGNREETAAWLSRILEGHPRVWVVLSHEEVPDPRGLLVSLLQQRGLLLDERWLAGIHLVAYSLQQRPNFEEPPIPQRRLVTFSERMALLGYRLMAPGPQERSLKVSLYWKNLVSSPQNLRVKLMVRDRQGSLWAQTDKVPLTELYPTSRWAAGEILTDYYEVPLTAGTPPGTYDLQLQVYDPPSQRFLVAQEEGALLPGGAASLGTVTLPQAIPAPLEEALASVETPVRRGLSSSLAVLGTSIQPRALAAGSQLQVTLLWQVQRPESRGDGIFLRLVNGRQQVASEQRAFPENALYPPSLWEAGTLVRTQHRVIVPRDLVPGRYQLQVTYFEPPWGTQLRAVPLSPITVREIPRRYDVPPLPTPQQANFSDQIELLGFALSPEDVAPGQEATLRLYWRPLVAVAEALKVFTHVVDREGRPLAQHDSFPALGSRPTTTWVAKEIIEDEHPLAIPKEMPPGAYAILVGFYRPETGERLLVFPSGPQGLDDKLTLKKALNVRPAQN